MIYGGNFVAIEDSYGSPGINSVIFYYGSYLIDELGNGDASGIYDSYGSPGTNDRLYDWKVTENGSIYFDDYHSYIYNSYGILRTRVVSVVVGLYI